MPWFKKKKRPKPIRDTQTEARSVPEGLWVKCEACREIIYSRDLERNLRICPQCRFHFRIGPDERTRLLLDDGEREELFAGIGPLDPLSFKDTKPYKDRIKAYQRKLGIRDAVHVYTGRVEQIPIILAVMDYRFMGGSMGSTVGEKITRAT